MDLLKKLNLFFIILIVFITQVKMNEKMPALFLSHGGKIKKKKK